MKKILSAIMACCMIVSLLSVCGCNGADTASKKSGTAASSQKTQKEENAERVIKDLGGKTITIASAADYSAYVKGESEIGDARLKELADIEKELNCKIKFAVYDNESLTSNLITTALSGSGFCDIAITVFWNTGALLTNRVAVDLNTVDSVHLSADYWQQNENDLLNVNGVQRAASCGFTCTPVSETAAVVFNKRIISEMGLENPYDLYSKDKWTVSKLREMAKTATKDLDGAAGMTANDQYGITTLDKGALIQDLLVTDGFRIISKEANDVFKYNMSDTNLVTRLKYYQDFFCNDGSIYSNADQDAQHAQFCNGKSLFYIFQLFYLSKFTEMSDDYGIVPFPRGDEQKTTTGEMNWNTKLMSIPTTVKGDALYDAGCVLDAFAYHSKDDNATMKKQIVGRYLRDSESIPMLDVISESAIHSADLLVASPRFDTIQDATSQVIAQGVLNSTYDFAQQIAQYKNSGKSLIAGFNASVVK